MLGMHVFLLAAITADGFIGRSADNRSFDWTSPEDKAFYVKMIKQAGVVVMGSTSFKTFTRYPRGLKFVIYTSKPEEFTNPKPEVITTWATQESPQAVLEQLKAEGHQEVAICGGASIYTMFMKAGLIDTLYLTVEATVFGQGIKLFNDEVTQSIELAGVEKLGDNTVLLKYTVKK
jgi:dihydrofolate reductase